MIASHSALKIYRGKR